MTMTTDTEQLLTTMEAADRLGVTIREVYALVEAGELETVVQEIPGRRGRWVHVRADQVEERVAQAL